MLTAINPANGELIHTYEEHSTREDEETFGPVAAVIIVRNEAEAIRTANDTAFGLGAAVFTNDVDHGERIAADKLEAGNCFVNRFVKSDPPMGNTAIRAINRAAWVSSLPKNARQPANPSLLIKHSPAAIRQISRIRTLTIFLCKNEYFI